MSEVIAQGRLTKLYADYVQACKGSGTQPVGFRVFAETMDEYDREWEIATHEYNKENK